jgi:tRNA(fMet)-specific endonuclease VapC
MKYILDTNICIYIIKKKPSSVFQKFRSLKPGSVGISSITLAELEFGIEKSIKPKQNRLALHQFLIPIDIVEFDSEAATEYGSVRAKLEKSGTQIGALDTLIAAHAKSLDCILVTNNEREFIRVNGLKVENWVK